MRVLAYRLQAEALGDLDPATLRRLERAGEEKGEAVAAPFANRRPPRARASISRPGAMLAREWRGRLERVTVLKDGFAWNGKTYGSLSMDRQGDHRRELERPSLLRAAVRRLRGDCDGLQWANGLDEGRAQDRARRGAVHPWAA